MPNGSPLSLKRVPQVRLGRGELTDATFVVMKSALWESHGGMRLGGLLGMDLMKSSAVWVDWRKHQLSVWTPGNLPRDAVAAAGFRPEDGLPLYPAPGGRFAFDITFADQQPARLLIDTGAPKTLIARRRVEALKLRRIGSSDGSTALEEATVGLTEGVRVRFGRLETWLEPLTYPVAPPQFARRVSEHVGMDLLRGLNFLIDFPAKRLYLTPTKLYVGPPIPPTGWHRPEVPASTENGG
jgi:hypothetical protein